MPFDPVSLALVKADAAAKFVPKPTERTAFLPVTAPNVSSSTTRNRTERTMIKLPFGVTRWRVWFANWNLRNASAPGGACSITGIAVGDPVYDSSTSSDNRWTGDCTGALTPLQTTAITVPTDGSKVASAWFDHPLAADDEVVLSWGILTSGSQALASGNSYAGVYGGAAADYATAALSGKSVGVNKLTLDVIVEYEFRDVTQIGLFIGDSNTVTYSPTAPPLISGAAAGALPHESWPVIAGQLGGFAAINFGVGSATPADFGTTYARMWSRADIASSEIDFAVCSLGTNGLNKDVTLFVAQFLAINAKLRATYGIDRIFWTTVTPRGYESAFARLSSPASPGATTVSLDRSPTLTGGQEILIGSGWNAETRLVSGSITGSGPYSATLTAALTNDHAANEPVATDSERSRRLVNNYLRTMPDGIAGVIDFEKLLERAVDEPSGDPRYFASDALHFMRGASLARAQAVVAAGVKPLII